MRAAAVSCPAEHTRPRGHAQAQAEGGRQWGFQDDKVTNVSEGSRAAGMESSAD